MVAKLWSGGEVLQLPMAEQSTTGTVKSCLFWHAMQHWRAFHTLLSTPFWSGSASCANNSNCCVPPHSRGKRPRNAMALADTLGSRLVQHALLAALGFMRNDGDTGPHVSSSGML